MKKLITFIMIVLLLVLILPAVTVMADVDSGPGMAVADFFDWGALSTYAGAVLATALIVQFTKSLPGIKKLPTRLWAYAIALVIMILATIFTVTNITVGVILLCFVNAILVAMAANGTYDAIAPNQIE